MPSTFAEPTLAELLKAFHDGVRVQRDRYADGREGAVYDHFAGVGAIHWARQARRDTDLFRAVYFGTAEATDLTRLLNDRYDFARVEESYGVGSSTLTRPTAAAADETIWKGTRLLVGSALVEATQYIVLEDVPVAAGDLTATVAIRAGRVGPGTAITVAPSWTGTVRIDDPLWDTTWTVTSLACAGGTSFESATESRARYRDLRRESRVGFVEALITACKNAGATNAIFFPSDHGGEDVDHGLNMAYVGDASFSGTDALVRRIQLELEDWRVLGDNLQVRALTRTDIRIKASINLWDTPARVNQTALRTLLTGAVLGYFDGATSGFSYDRDALAGAMMKASPAVQFASFALPVADAGVLSTVGGRLNFPPTLPRYRVRPDDVILTFLPPA